MSKKHRLKRIKSEIMNQPKEEAFQPNQYKWPQKYSWSAIEARVSKKVEKVINPARILNDPVVRKHYTQQFQGMEMLQVCL